MRTNDSNEKMKNKEIWDKIKMEKERERSNIEYMFKRLNTPCETCGRMPDEHPRCNCLVMHCCGYKIGSSCPDYDIDEDSKMKKVTEYDTQFGKMGLYERGLYKPGEKVPEVTVTEYNDDGTNKTYTYSEWKKLHP